MRRSLLWVIAADTDLHLQFGPTGDKNVNKEQRERFQRYLTSYIKWFVHEFDQYVLPS